MDAILKALKDRFSLKERSFRSIDRAQRPWNLSSILVTEFLNKVDKNGGTVLGFRVANGNPSAVEMLLREGASLIPNKAGKTPLDIALESNLDEILEKFKIHTGYLRQIDENRKTPVQDANEGRKHAAMEFFIKIEGHSPGVLYDSDRKLCIQYAGETGRRDLMRILSSSDHGHASVLRPTDDAVAGVVPPGA